MEMNAKVWAEAIKNGDEKAFRAFYDAYFERIHRFLTTMLRSSDDAEDVTSIAFIYVWDNREKLRQPELLVSWLYQIAKHRALDHLRKNGSAKTSSLDNLPEMWVKADDDTQKTTDDYFLAQKVEALLVHLSGEERAIVHLRFSEDLAFSEIAQRLGFSAVAVRVRLHRIIRRLKKNVEESADSMESAL